MKSRRRNNLILVILLLIISVGFALLSSNLNIIGNSSIKRTVWNIYWDNVQKTEGSITGDNELVPAHIIGENNDTVEYSVILDTPGDYYEFTVDAVNDSTLDAMIDDISLDFYEEDGETPKELPSYLTYSIKYADDTEVYEEDLLDAGETKTYKVRLEFIYDIDPEDLPTEGDVISLKFKVDYVQATNTKVNYTVTHKYEKLDSGYDTETETLKGPAGTQVTPEVKGRTGFISPQPQTVTIQADGSTNVIYTYTREEYTFAITDRTYIDPTSTPDGTYKYGTEITLKAQERPGYEFHWSDGDTNYNRTLTLEDNLSLTPIYEINEYVITLNPNGGSVSPTTISVTPGEKIGTIPTPTNGTQLFGGWYTATTGGEEVTKDTIPTGDMEIFARWFASDIVAVVNDTDGYTTYAAALAAAPTDGSLTKVKLIQNTSASSADDILTAAGTNIVFDLNGFTISHSGNSIIKNDGTITIKNGTLACSATQGALNVNKDATMILDNVTITATGTKQGVYNKGGNLTIKDSTISSTVSNRAAVHTLKDGSTDPTTTIIGNTTITSTGYAGLYIEGGTVTIGTKDGTIENSPVIEGKTYGVQAFGTYEFYDGLIKGKTGSIGIAASATTTPSVSPDTNHTKITAIEDDSDYVDGTDGQYKTLTLDYLTPKYTIELNANGGEVTPTQIKIDQGSPIGEIPTPTYDAFHTFNGWYTQVSGGIEVDSTYIPTGNMEIFAHWTEIPSYLIEFDENGGSSVDDMRVPQGSAITSLPTSLKEGNCLLGWYTGIPEGTKIEVGYIPTGNMNLIAHWGKSVSSMIIDPDEITITSYRGTDTINITNAEEIQEPYTFASNDTSIATVDSNGVVTAVAEGRTTITITGTVSGETKEVTIIVKYTRYDITFEENGGSDVEDKVVFEGQAIGTLPTTYLDHYFLEGWYTELQGGTKINENYIPQDDMVIYAHYTRAPNYTITFDANGGTVDEQSRVVSGDMAVGELPTPTRENYYFMGWKDEDSNEYYTSNMLPTKNVTLTAQWDTVERVARINSTYYPSIQSAFDAAQKDDEVVLLVDRTESPINNKKITFNLDKHTVTGQLTNNTNGNLTLLNGNIEYELSSSDVKTIDNSGTLMIGNENQKLEDGVNIKATSTATSEAPDTYGIYGDTGKVTMNGGSINATSSKYRAIGIHCKNVIMNGGEIITTGVWQSNIGISGAENGTVVMNGGNINSTGNSINEKFSTAVGIHGGLKSTIIMNGGNITATGTSYGEGIYGAPANTIIMNGGNINSTGNSRAYGINQGKSITVNGGTITVMGNNVNSYAYGIYEASSTNTTINGGNITVKGNYQATGIHLLDETILIVNEGTITTTSPYSHGIDSGHDTTTSINGGNITVISTGNYSTYGIYGYTNSAIEINDGNITAIANNGDVCGIYGYSGGTVAMNGGRITAIGSDNTSYNAKGICGYEDIVTMTDGIIYSKGPTKAKSYGIEADTKIYPEGKTLFEETSPDNYEVYYLVPTSTGTKTITFNANGGSVFPTSMTKKNGEAIGTMPTPTRTNYDFAGWYTAASGGDEVTSSTIINSDMPVYAHWTEIPEFTITFDKNNSSATGIMNPQTIRKGDTASINTNTYELSGYLFVGWNTKSDGSGTSYLDKDYISLTKDITLYAQWVKTYTLTFDKNNPDATGNTYTQTLVSGVSTPIDDSAFSAYSLADKVIDSYNTDASGTGTVYYQSQSITITSDTTLYAYWNYEVTNTIYWALQDNNNDNINEKLIISDSEVTGNKSGSFSGYTTFNSNQKVPWVNTDRFADGDNKTNLSYDVTTVSIEGKVVPKSTAYWFCGVGFGASTFDANLDNLIVSRVTDMSYMLTATGQAATTWSIGDLSNWDTSNVTKMIHMFGQDLGYGAGYNATTWDIGDLSGWNTSNVIYMTAMFENAGNGSQTWDIGDISNWKVSKVESMDSMFLYAGRNEETWSVGDISNWDTSEVKSIRRMFSGAGYYSTTFNLDLSNWDTSQVTNMESTFSSAGGGATTWNIKGLNNWDVSKVTNMNYMFNHAGKNATDFSLNLSGWKLLENPRISWMFDEAGYNSTTFSLNLSNWDVSNIDGMYHTFSNTGYSATTWEIVGLNNWKTSNVTDMTYVFQEAGHNASTFNINLSNWNTSNVTEMSSMFNGAGYSATTWNIGDLSGWKTSNVTYMTSMFENAGYSASTWSVGDIKGWDTSKLIHADSMFRGAGHDASAVNIDLSDWNTSKVADMNRMFYLSGYKTSTFHLDLSNWDTSSVTNMDYMFDGAGYSATTFSITIPQTNGNDLNNTISRMYGKNTSTSASPPNGKGYGRRDFTLASS